MKIIHVIDYFQPKLGYQETFLAKNHLELGHEVHVITSERYNPCLYAKSKCIPILGSRIQESGFFNEDGLKIWRLKIIFELHHLLWMQGLVRKIREISPDLIIVHGVTNLAAIQIALLKKRGTGFKLIYDDHATFVNSKSCLYPIFRYFFSAIIINKADAFVAILPATQQFMTKQYGIPKNKIQIIPLGADKNRFCFSGSARVSTRNELCLQESETVFIYTGKIQPEKNLKLLFDAMNILIKKRICNIKLLIVGDSPDLFINEIKDYAVTLKIDGSIIWHKMVLNKDLKNYYSAADIGVWPYGASASMLEAMACNLPIIISDCSEVTDLVAYDNGYLFKENNANDLSSKMELLLNKNLRAEMGEKSRNYIEEQLNWSIISQKFLNLVEGPSYDNNSF
ncbi:MAG: glycosyltransferase family 4 protein [Methanoregula sp.]